MTTPTYLSGLLFTKAHRLVRARIYELLGSYHLNPTLWSLLSIVNQSEDGVRSSIVAEHIGIKPPMVTLLADQLVAQGLLRRVTHPGDGRVRMLKLSAKGKKLVDKLEIKLSDEIGKMLSGLSEQEILVFQKTLSTIISNAQ